MAVKFDAATVALAESTSGPDLQIDHQPINVPRGILIFTFVNLNAEFGADLITGVTYANINVPPLLSPDSLFSNTITGEGYLKAWFLSSNSLDNQSRKAIISRQGTGKLTAIVISLTAGQNPYISDYEVITPTVLPILQNSTDASFAGNSIGFCAYLGYWDTVYYPTGKPVDPPPPDTPQDQQPDLTTSQHVATAPLSQTDGIGFVVKTLDTQPDSFGQYIFGFASYGNDLDQMFILISDQNPKNSIIRRRPIGFRGLPKPAGRRVFGPFRP